MELFSFFFFLSLLSGIRSKNILVPSPVVEVVQRGVRKDSSEVGTSSEIVTATQKSKEKKSSINMGRYKKEKKRFKPNNDHQRMT